MHGQRFAFGSFLLNLGNGTLFRNGDLVAVGQRSAFLLGALLKSRGEVVTKAELMDAAWPGTAVEESNLSVQIASLRKLLGPAPDGGEWIVTVPRVGYRFVGDAEALMLGDAPAPRSEAVAPSLAVIPFQNLSGNPQQDYFADGVVEDIITALSRFRSFGVIARNSSFYKGSAVDVREAARDLRARYVLEGSVQRAGNRLRITAQLVDGVIGAHLWARNFDGALEDVFDFQDRITETVAMLVEPRIQAAEIDRSRRERPGSVAIYDIYLQALTKISSESAEDNADAYALLSEALALEPDNAVFLAHAAWALEHRSTMGWPLIGPDHRRKCGELARRGLQHARGDAMLMAHCGMSLVLCAKDYDWGLAVVQAAVESNPNNLMIVVRAGIANLLCGSLDEALAYLHRANRLSPGDPGAHFSLTGIAMVHLIRGDYSGALVWAARSLASNPNFDATYWMLIAANAHLDRMGEAHRFLRELKEVSPGVTVASIRAGQPDKHPSRVAAILEGLRLAGLEEG